MAITHTFRTEGQKYLFQACNQWFLPEAEPIYISSPKSSLRETINEQDIDKLLISDFTTSKVKKVKVACFRVLGNLAVNYFVSPVGVFYHGFYIGKKIVPLAISKLFEPHKDLKLDDEDKNELKTHALSCVGDFVSLVSTAATYHLLVNGALKTCLVAFLNAKKETNPSSIIDRALFHAALLIFVASLNATITYCNSFDAETFGYGRDIQNLGLDDETSQAFILRHYLGLCRENGGLLSSENKDVKNNPGITFTPEDYKDGSFNINLFNKFRNWVDQDIFIQQYRRLDVVMKDLEETLYKKDRSLIFTSPLSLELKILECEKQKSQDRNLLADLKRLKQLWKTQEAYLKCAEFSFDFSHKSFSHLHGPERNYFYFILNIYKCLQNSLGGGSSDESFSETEFNSTSQNSATYLQRYFKPIKEVFDTLKEQNFNIEEKSFYHPRSYEVYVALEQWYQGKIKNKTTADFIEKMDKRKFLQSFYPDKVLSHENRQNEVLMLCVTELYKALLKFRSDM